MKKFFAAAAFSLFLFPSGEGIVRLKDGTFLFGEVVAHDENGIQVRRLDTGGLVTLKWGHLFPAEENDLRLKYGYKDQSGEEVKVSADRLRLDDGTERIGIIIDRTANDILLRVRETPIPIPKSRVTAPADRVEVNALDIYTKDQLFEAKVAELNPQTAEQFLDLGRYLVRIHDIKRALESYKKAQTLDAAFHPDEVSGTIARLENQAAKQEEIDWVDSIDSARGKKDYAKALDLCQVFAQKWPQSTFLPEVTRKKARIETDRTETLQATVVMRWYQLSEKLGGKFADKRDMTLEESKAYAEKELSKDVLAKVAEEMKKIQPEITPEQVRAIWDKRGKLASSHRAVYGDGTFILGAEAAQKGIGPKDKEKAKEKKESGNAAEQQLQNAVKKYIQQYQKAQSGAAGQATEDDAPEAWWKGARSSERQQWILAYYAEFAGDMIFLHAFADLCQTCGGAGLITYLLSGQGSSSGSGNNAGGGGNQSGGSGTAQVPCPSCHKVQIKRGVYYQ